jgi:hypothetical protein
VPVLFFLLWVGASACAQGSGSSPCGASGRSPTLLADNGGAKAWAQTVVRGRDRRIDPVSPSCTAQPTLFVSPGLEGSAVKAAYTQVPTNERPAAAIDLVDFSPSGNMLLVHISTYQTEGEGSERTPAVYDLAAGKLRKIPVRALLKRAFGSGCSDEVAAPGFLPDGKLLLVFSPLHADETYQPLNPRSCTSREVRRRYDVQNGQMGPISAGKASTKYSHVLKKE